MKIKDIVDSQKDKKCLVTALGPSLNPYLDNLDSYCNGRILIGCNLWFRHYDKIPDYWVLANPSITVAVMREKLIKYHDFENHKPTLLYADSVDLTPKDQIPKLIENIPYIGYDQRHFKNNKCSEGIYYQSGRNCCEHIEQNRLTIQEELQAYCSYHEHYRSGDTVLVHMIAFGILLGCKEIEVIGADLNYANGYAKSIPADLSGLPSNIIETPEKNVLNHCIDSIKKDLNIIVNSAKNKNCIIKGISV